MSDDSKERRRLLETVRGLKPVETVVLQLLSVIYMPVSAGGLARAALRYNSGLQQLGNALQSLEDLGLLAEGDAGIRCHPLLCEPLTQAALKSGSFHTLAGVARDTLWHDGGWNDGENAGYEQLAARQRIALYQGNAAQYKELSEICNEHFPAETAARPVAAAVCSDQAYCGFLRGLPRGFLVSILAETLNHFLRHLQPADHLLEMLEEVQAQAPQPLAAVTLAAQWIYRGRFSKALKYAKTLPAEYGNFFRGWIDLVSGRAASARELLEPGTEERRVVPLRLTLYLLALLQGGRLNEAARLAVRANADTDNVCAPLQWLVRQKTGAGGTDAARELPEPPEYSPLARLFTWLAWHWESDARLSGRLSEVEGFFTAARAGGYGWLAAEAAALRAAREAPEEVVWAAKLANAVKACKCVPLAGMLQPRPAWERPLTALSALAREQSADGMVEDLTAVRMIWQIAYDTESGICELFALEQRTTLSGQWGRGKRLTWQSLYQPENVRPYMTEQDHRICAAITREVRNGQTVYELDYERALPAIVGHPLVFLADNRPVRVEMVSCEPELLALKESARADNPDAPAGVRLSLSPAVQDEEKVVLTQETPTRFRVTAVKPVHWHISRILGKDGMFFPEAALPQVREVIGELSAFLTVQSEIGGTVETGAAVPADKRLRAQLLPDCEGLQVSFYVRPFGDRGSYYRPGAGAGMLISDFDGARVRTLRDLPQECAALDAVVAACSALRQAQFANQTWHLLDAVDCLEFLLQLRELGEAVVPEWPQGGKRKVSRVLTPQSLRVRVDRRGDWFEMTGSLKVSEDLTLSMRELLQMSAQATGRFVKIGEDQYLALTDSFRRQLDDLAAFGDLQDEALRLSPLAALALEDLSKDAGEFAADLEWKQNIAKLRSPEDFSLPAGLNGSLRDYQLRGFQWLANLAAWNFGACLADDMGLGKTVQTLSLLLHRADCGPSLVVAPTSVCYNWIDEGARFAPELRFALFGADDRAASVAEIGKGGVLVCSYAMLQQEEELITGKVWGTAVLDEAQAIKNAATKRSQAAMKLQAGFRLVTTGTPIENHLGELWNIFNFLNRGLLGSHKRFQERFAVPIEKDQDSEARDRLKRLLRPFILRRLKTQVLTELPSRTEIVKTVPMSEEETAFYEALRREAVEKLNDVKLPREQRSFRILAEIMRLRRACCNPRLVAPEVNIASSKLAEFGRIVDGLRENGHRVLVFSQFVDHLSLVREYLDGKEISYQYLDGSTPEKNRRKIVKDFQNGAGDLFLISLKAGGQGLNLTAADYVIHLDPWWNPAVEDQASDRAHRIGQTRPVTIYRLVMQGSIEEKIVDLHRRKRDLADSLLSDSDLGGCLNAEELLRLIKGAL